MEKIYYTYLILTEKGTYYCGYTVDIKARYKKHLMGEGAKYTKANKPQKLAYLKIFNTKSEAMKEEYRIKGLKRAEKITLVENFEKDSPELYSLACKIAS